MLNQDQIKNYHEKGYVVLDNFFCKAELHSVKEEIGLIVRSYLKKNKIFNDITLDQALFKLESVGHEHIAAVYDTICMASSFLRAQYKENMQIVINQLLDKPLNNPLYAFKNRIRIDPPNDNRRTYGWHQEVFYSIPRSDFIQSWSPIVRDTTIENGTIFLAEGSHKDNIQSQQWLRREGYADQIIRTDEQIESQYKTKQLEMSLGQIVFFSGKTWHKSGNNTSRGHRFSMIGMWHDIDKEQFVAPKINFSYRGETPEEYYKNYFKQGRIAT